MMSKGMTILYKVHNNLYVNLTNKCTCNCTFCLRNTKETVGESDTLWLEREPSVEEVEAEFKKYNLDDYDEIVFCGFGEPTERIDDLVEIAGFVKKTYGKKTRLNTNGQGSLSNGKDIAPMLEGVMDTVSISLNTPNEDRYHEIVRSRFGDQAYQAMLDFAKEVKKYVPNVVMTTVSTTISKEEEEQCRKICETLGVKYRIRPFE
ncbi:MAG: TIGR04100 family radical SAM protein [Lachnospiraceae bacterium]|nr:TIGR04100 family radical SAM protein [Lachnospiraceae bacterium]